MKQRGNRDASHRMYVLRVPLVLLTLALLVLLSGCALRNHQGTAGQPGQQTTGQQAGTSQGTGSASAAQQIQDADQQVQNAMQGLDGAENDANNANNQSSQESTVIP